MVLWADDAVNPTLETRVEGSEMEALRAVLRTCRG